jgi:vacuolar-type H+-ATPase subunit I/STV1
MAEMYDSTDEDEEDARAQAPADFQITQVKRNLESAARDRLLCLGVGVLSVFVGFVILIIHNRGLYGALLPAFGFGVVFLGLGALFTYQANAAAIEATRMEELRAALNHTVDERDKHRTE